MFRSDTYEKPKWSYKACHSKSAALPLLLSRPRQHRRTSKLTRTVLSRRASYSRESLASLCKTSRVTKNLRKSFGRFLTAARILHMQSAILPRLGQVELWRAQQSIIAAYPRQNASLAVNFGNGFVVLLFQFGDSFRLDVGR